MNQNRIPKPRSSILSLPEYVPGEQSLEGIIEPIKLSSNESNLGPSPKSLEAFSDFSSSQLFCKNYAVIYMNYVLVEWTNFCLMGLPL